MYIAVIDDVNVISVQIVDDNFDGKEFFDYVVLSDYDYTMLNSVDLEQYNILYCDNSFEIIKKTEPEPTESELIQAELLLNQADILARQNEHDEVLAEILLNQMGV